ncbi:hypothetical protein [Saccharicrinis aurantiacus]|uniref:hypothetical protein n=1 Tax=Saccharicrinis aurantiacus TaxID=1849719 RepID=UPI00094FADD9|nr:hypothetical protein [Saccharicrinis aurantiacus]
MEKDKNNSVKFNSVQLNIVTFVDVPKADVYNSLSDAVYMCDNNIESENQGTNGLQTLCKTGQTLNWIIYAMDSKKKPDGTWPPSARITNIVFTNADGTDVADFKVCNELKLIGPPDEMRSPYTPVYYYWAATVAPMLPEGIYKYRLIVEVDTQDKTFASGKKNLNLNTPSLKVLAV